ncbi:hypothetical protein SKAU_G00367600 [Synaphobranchus kaupii]|uniref:Uncharacterized protein n=1 Tax=Synaphobranchus kaupii TaxID=118154 RepID=A0A9Q1EFE4_SYNKA|nr:hypothetical protein SKAU_G00367600 [Synaphobranchus kaupii]
MRSTESRAGSRRRRYQRSFMIVPPPHRNHIPHHPQFRNYPTPATSHTAAQRLQPSGYRRRQGGLPLSYSAVNAGKPSILLRSETKASNISCRGLSELTGAVQGGVRYAQVKGRLLSLVKSNGGD